ncbi:hypothetical protein ALC53_07721, partial [Atta colombica]
RQDKACTINRCHVLSSTRTSRRNGAQTNCSIDSADSVDSELKIFIPRTRPVANCSSKAGSTLANRCLAFTPLATQWQYIMTFIPLSERRSIDGDNSVLHQSFGSY